jgi:hypothetical protein
MCSDNQVQRMNEALDQALQILRPYREMEREKYQDVDSASSPKSNYTISSLKRMA